MKRWQRCYLAIDPGDAHVGFASLQTTGRSHYALTGVLHRQSRGDFATFVDEILALMPGESEHTLVVESFQVRPVGHQRFTAGETLQLIGALRFAAGARGLAYATVMPGNAAKDLAGLGLAPRLDAWLPQPRPSRWEHAWSAWRVLGRFMLGHDTERLLHFTNREMRTSMRQDLHSAYTKDLLSPTLIVQP